MRVRIVVPVFFVSIAASALAFSQNFAHRPNLPPGATEAVAAFDDQTNGFVAEQADHIVDAMQFNEHDSLTQGLGPLYNADSCGSCHFNPVAGGISEVTELRAGHIDRHGIFVEAPGQTRVGRFGWKNQHASLTSFSADAYVNEMGITTPFFPTERTSLGIDVSSFSQGSVPNNPGDDVDTFARFLRATKAPPRDLAAAITADAQQGAHVFEAIGCGVCHVSTIVTAPANTLINGGTLTVPEALGNKIIHPFGDFLLHDVGTGDGIVQNGGQETATKLRTAPLWGARMRNRLMHDGNSLTFENAIDRHRGEADDASDNFRRLSPRQKNALIAFLHSL